ncbi:glycoside hydrolase family 18 protein [Peniophora sp. CONT]|nr:glycoside hydrolase family 18 protein [Peniophora sp. CONT]
MLPLAILPLGASLLPLAAAWQLPHNDSDSDSPKPVAATWFAGWHADQGFSVSNISWDKYTHITYSFAETTEDGGLTLNGSEPDVLPSFVTEAKKHGVKALVSLGGWTGSRWFSTAIGSPENRTAFVNTVNAFAEEYDLDGVDFDWEAPGTQGIGCNAISPNDTSNFLAFLQEFRATEQGSKLFVTAASGLSIWADENGDPSTNATAFGELFDYIAIMNYDIYGSWCDTAGPNAPLYSSCSTDNNQGSAEIGIQAWIDAGVPANKLVLGVPSYGHSYTVAKDDALSKQGKLNAYPLFDASLQPVGDSWDDANPGPDECGAPQTAEGVFDFWGLIEGGFLNAFGEPAWGIEYEYDECSQTPAVYNATSGVWISYDNPRSFYAKGEFIKKLGLRGFAMWEAGGDYNDMLLNSIRLSTMSRAL